MVREHVQTLHRQQRRTVTVVMMCFFLSLWKRATPLMAMLFDSVAPDVKMISFGSACSRSATFLRASSTNSSASQPYMCVRECALPYLRVVSDAAVTRTVGAGTGDALFSHEWHHRIEHSGVDHSGGL